MKNKFISVVIIGLVFSMSNSFAGDKHDFNGKVKKDIESFQNFFKKKFPSVELDDYANGVYALDSASREQWQEIEEFPPYELNVDNGEILYNKPFANGKTYADCFANKGISIVQDYPYFDEKSKQVMTIELALNNCRESNGEKALKYKTGAIADISAYMSFTSRGKIIDIKVDTKDAYNAYMSGKKFFYAKRGQLNFSCADCHMRLAGQKLRADIAGPAIGQTTGFPVYRSKWNGLGTLHRRYGGCNKNIRALPFKAQSTEYRELQYFQTAMNNGFKINGPSARK